MLQSVLSDTNRENQQIQLQENTEGEEFSPASDSCQYISSLSVCKQLHLTYHTEARTPERFICISMAEMYIPVTHEADVCRHTSASSVI